MQEIIQLFAAFLGSLGFAVLFNIRGEKLVFAALGDFCPGEYTLGRDILTITRISADLLPLYCLLFMQNVWLVYTKRRLRFFLYPPQFLLFRSRALPRYE